MSDKRELLRVSMLSLATASCQDIQCLMSACRSWRNVEAIKEKSLSHCTLNRCPQRRVVLVGGEQLKDPGDKIVMSMMLEDVVL